MTALQPMNVPPVLATALPEGVVLPAPGSVSAPASFVMPELLPVAVAAESVQQQPVKAAADSDTPVPDDVAAQLAQLLNLLVPQEAPVAAPAAELTAQTVPAGIETLMPPVKTVAEPKPVSAQTSAALVTAARVAEGLSQPGAQNTLKPLAMSPALLSLAQQPEGSEKPQPGNLPQPAGMVPASFHTANNLPDSTQGRQDAASKTLNIPLNVTDGTQIQGEKLRQVLGERLQLQLDNRVQHATIRLDPPDLGKIDISLQLDANKLQVQIQAGQPEVARALQQVSHELRQSLTAQNNLQVQVNISSQQQHPQGQHQQHAQTPYQPDPRAHIAAPATGRNTADGMSSATPADTSILTTV